ncbi:hypothetical protein NLG97_g8266 [Lecanicillium saksenae]|uniref:Uncharacterized protein n=1 Tax=Lecanicillium saksenae TaxID=468837 RepID=A0ACC1QM15_9HYPO|nr:hypothetical protein NLG97_g8266 [Lecanicillium saksenae]
MSKDWESKSGIGVVRDMCRQSKEPTRTRKGKVPGKLAPRPASSPQTPHGGGDEAAVALRAGKPRTATARKPQHGSPNCDCVLLIRGIKLAASIMLSVRAVAAARRVPVLRRKLVSTRTYATEQSTNPTASFYKTFSRPIAKVMILAVFTYQVAYWSWTKLEADEAREKIDAEIGVLEKKVEEYKESKTAGKTQSK